MLSKSFLFCIFLIATQISIVCPTVALGQDKLGSPSIQDRYQQAKFFYNQLETKPNLGSDRDLWLKGSRNFRKVYLANPKSELAPASLFMLGKIYLRIYEKFHNNSDLEESISYYRDCYSLFPHHRLADDSLFALGNIYFKDFKNHQKASYYYTKVLSRYPTGDMHPQAATQLKILSSEYNIALPDVMVGEAQHKKLTTVLPVKYWSSKDYSRVIIKASGPVTHSAQLLEKKGDKPRRLYIDFQNSYIEPKYRTPVPVADGLLKQIRTGQYSQDTVRVVLDIESISTYKIFSLPNPFRVVVDIRGIKPFSTPINNKPIHALQKPSIKNGKIIVLRDSKKRKVHSEKSQDQLIEEIETPQLSLAQQLGLGVRKIVIDPGHGGKDPGAIAHGLKEKDVVLTLAKKLQSILVKSLDCKVVLTRNDDRYISLEERTAIANVNNADLFISVHVNAHPKSSVNGLETYFLNLSTNSEAMRVAAFENATSEMQMSDLQDILSDILKNSKIKESSRLAHNVHNSLIHGLRENFEGIKDLGVKQAPFFVLIGAEMPAILIEMAFISNPVEAGMLRQDDFLNIFAEKISYGVESYIHSNTAQFTRRILKE